MLTDAERAELRAEITADVRAIIRAELQQAVMSLVDEGFSPIAELVIDLQQKQGSLLKTLCESAGAIVESQARVERAVADATGGGDENEPWRESLNDD